MFGGIFWSYSILGSIPNGAGLIVEYFDAPLLPPGGQVNLDLAHRQGKGASVYRREGKEDPIHLWQLCR